MSDPVGERLRSYYDSIQSDAPASLEARVARALGSAATGPAARPSRAPWRPAFGLVAVGVGLLIAALIFRGLGPGPSPSTVTGPSASASASGSPGASPSESPSAQVTPTAIPNPTSIGESPSPSPTATPAPSAIPTLAPTPTPHSTGTLLSLGAMAPALSGPAVNLNDATVLVVGGMVTQSNGIRVKSNLAELYQMGSHTFVATGSMADARYGHTATLLRDGRVLVVGGADLMDGIDNLATAELYDPLTGKFTRTGSMAQGRADHTATLLGDGRVLIAGGFGGGTLPLATAEIYDPASGAFTATGPMTVARQNHTANLLPGGQVLIAGGIDDNSHVLASAELYDPASGTFHATGSMTAAREFHTATALGDDRILIAGGTNGVGGAAKPLVLAEIYDPSTGRFTSTGSMTIPRRGHTATLLAYGQVVVAGGDGTNSLEVYWPDTGKFGYGQALAGPISSAATMSDRVLFTGNPPELYCSWPASQGSCG
jgi:hypothetical protein